jgi:hypothetical protein
MPDYGRSLYVLFDLITASCRYIHKNPVKVNIVKNPLEYKRFGYKQEYPAFTINMPGILHPH